MQHPVASSREMNNEQTRLQKAFGFRQHDLEYNRRGRLTSRQRRRLCLRLFLTAIGGIVFALLAGGTWSAASLEAVFFCFTSSPLNWALIVGGLVFAFAALLGVIATSYFLVVSLFLLVISLPRSLITNNIRSVESPFEVRNEAGASSYHLLHRRFEISRRAALLLSSGISSRLYYAPFPSWLTFVPEKWTLSIELVATVDGEAHPC